MLEECGVKSIDKKHLGELILKIMNTIEQGVASHIANAKQKDAKRIFSSLIQTENYVGDVYSINYEYANVLIHEKHRHQVGGIPSLSFLIATRIYPEGEAWENIDFQKEESSVILLRVMDAASLPQDAEAERIRVETAESISGEPNTHWDANGNMDYRTRNYLSFAGVKCRIIGTFYLEEKSESELQLKFGCDISNYYPNRDLKVYKPTAKALEMMVNYSDPSVKKQERVSIGHIRYASTNRQYQHVDDVPVSILPSDLLSQKTALFGMTRTGKSNTTKIIAKSVYELRRVSANERIGQIIFDPNGEYANENEQDNNNALKNVWKLINEKQKENEVVTYGITPHPNDKDRHLMLVNFYLDENLQIGKDIINSILTDDSTNYIKNFIQVNLNKPENVEPFGSEMTRFKRRVLAYRSILKRAGFPVPSSLKPLTKGLFCKELLSAMDNSQSDDAVEYKSAAKIFDSSNQSNITWDQVGNAFEALDKFMRDPKSGYKDVEDQYVNRPNGSGDRWADEELKKIIGIFQYPNGTRKIGKAISQHSASTSSDYADDIYNDLISGKLVIVDQSCGEPELNKSSSYRIVNKIFKNNQQKFINGDINIPEILVYIEEAHNVLPTGNDIDTSDIWVRTAKEGAKYHIGMVYATQEVSSIQKNILKNTANWFISHLNNTDETRELCKYYDFADFEPSIRRAQDKGFLRVKTLSNFFVIPVQIDKFELIN